MMTDTAQNADTTDLNYTLAYRSGATQVVYTAVPMLPWHSNRQLLHPQEHFMQKPHVAEDYDARHEAAYGTNISA